MASCKSKYNHHLQQRQSTGILYGMDTNTMDQTIDNEELCTTGSNHAVITWVTPGRAADTTVYVGENPISLAKLTLASDTAFHRAEVPNLKPSTRYWYRVESNGARGSLNSFRTLPRPCGKYLFSFAIFSDSHVAFGDPIGDIREIYLGKLVEYSGDLLTQCILDSKRRNIDLAVITGDLTDSASQLQYIKLRKQLLPCFGDTPYLLCIGNHDKYEKKSGIGEQGFLNYIAGREKTYASRIFREHQFLLIDSCTKNNNWGYIEPAQMQWVESMLRKNIGRPSYLFLHHPNNGLDVWFGIKNYKEFRETIKPFPNVCGIFCGHIHRNKVTTNQLITGNLPYVQLPSTVQYPCAYAVARVYEKGFEYNSYKTSRLDLSEMSREKFILKNGGKAVFAWYSFGSIGDRSFSYFNGRLHRPKQYELSVTAGHAKAMELYRNAQIHDGASLAPAAEAGKSKVILGRYESAHLANQAYRRIYSRYNIKSRIIKEGIYETPKEVDQHAD